MTRLVQIMRAMELDGEVDLEGRWVKLQGECFAVNVVEARWGSGYYTWCNDPQERVIEHYADPRDAIEAGLRRASKRQAQIMENDTDGKG